MGRGRTRVTAAAVVVAALSCVAVGPADASSAAAAAAAANRPTWQVVYHQLGVNIQAISATGPKGAWGIGADKAGGVLLHWDGVSWRPVHYPDQRNYLPSQIFALSPTDMWLFGYDSTQPAEILHWSNGFWSTMSLPVNAQNVDVLGDGDIWLEGGMLPHCNTVNADSQGCTITSHWNGSTWTSYPLRAFEGVTFGGTSKSDVWAVGDSFVRVMCTWRQRPRRTGKLARCTGTAAAGVRSACQACRGIASGPSLITTAACGSTGGRRQGSPGCTGRARASSPPRFTGQARTDGIPTGSRSLPSRTRPWSGCSGRIVAYRGRAGSRASSPRCARLPEQALP